MFKLLGDFLFTLILITSPQGLDSPGTRQYINKSVRKVNEKLPQFRDFVIKGRNEEYNADLLALFKLTIEYINPAIALVAKSDKLKNIRSLINEYQDIIIKSGFYIKDNRSVPEKEIKSLTESAKTFLHNLQKVKDL